jgi:hypothetical protein
MLRNKEVGAQKQRKRQLVQLSPTSRHGGERKKYMIWFRWRNWRISNNYRKQSIIGGTEKKSRKGSRIRRNGEIRYCNPSKQPKKEQFEIGPAVCSKKKMCVKFIQRIAVNQSVSLDLFELLKWKGRRGCRGVEAWRGGGDPGDWLAGH